MTHTLMNIPSMDDCTFHVIHKVIPKCYDIRCYRMGNDKTPKAYTYLI